MHHTGQKCLISLDFCLPLHSFSWYNEGMKQIAKKTPKMLRVEANQGIEIEELLRKLFVDEHKSIHAISSQLGISYPVVISWLDKAGIYSRRLLIM